MSFFVTLYYFIPHYKNPFLMTLPTRKCPVDSFEEREGGLPIKKRTNHPIDSSFSFKIDVGSVLFFQEVALQVSSPL